MIVLAGDPSLTAFGYVVYNESTKVILEMGCLKTAKEKGAVTKSDQNRLTFIAQELVRLISEHNVDQIVVEIPIGAKSFNAAKALFSIRALIIGVAVAQQVDIQTLGAKNIKEFLVGDKNADKELVFSEVVKSFPQIKEPVSKMTKEKRMAISDAIAVYLTYRNIKARSQESST